MVGRLAALAVLVVLAAPVAAAEQSPPDERAAARAFADAGLRLAAAVQAVEPKINRGLAPPRCARRLASRIPRRHLEDAYVLVLVHEFGRIARLVDGPLRAFSHDLQAVETEDPALRSGRAAWRRAQSLYVAAAAFADLDVCAELRRFVDGGFRRTPTVRRTRQLAEAFARFGEDEFERRIGRAIARMRELGVPAAEAHAFGGDIGREDEHAPAAPRTLS
jgi:hypothetical protein